VQYHLREILPATFERTIQLPAEVNTDQAETKFEYGVLMLHLPKAETAKPKRITIRSEQ
jgi:HSP20 family protein